jgi:hypothetical protein
LLTEQSVDQRAVRHATHHAGVVFATEFRSLRRTRNYDASSSQQVRHWTSSRARGISTRKGLILLPDPRAASGMTTVSLRDIPAAAMLDTALSGIRSRYGARSAALVALQLEYALPGNRQRGTC